MNVTGSIHVLEGLPNPDQTNSTQLSEAQLSDHVLMIDPQDAWAEKRYFRLKFDLFPFSRPPFALRSHVRLQIEGIYQPTHFQVVEIGEFKQPFQLNYILGSAKAVYQMKPQKHTLHALFILQDFSDGANVCGTPQALEQLVWTGTQNMRAGYLEISNNMEEIAQNGPQGQPFSTFRVAGPWQFNFSIYDDCENYLQWRQAALEKAILEGFDLSQYGTIVMVHPQPVSCAWAGRATVSNQCDPPGGNLIAPCLAAMLRCAPFVFMHEIGHNLFLQHAAIDPQDDDIVAVSETYLDYSCLMGNYNSWNKLNSIDMMLKGWLGTNSVVYATVPGIYTLSSLDIPTSSATFPQAIYVEDRPASSTLSSREYVFSMRTPVGYASTLLPEYLNGVNVHKYLQGWMFFFF